MTIKRQPGTPHTTVLQGLTHAKLLMVTQDLCIQRDELIDALSETLRAFSHCNEVYVPQLTLSAPVREAAQALLERLTGPDACQCGTKQCDECPR